LARSRKMVGLPYPIPILLYNLLSPCIQEKLGVHMKKILIFVVIVLFSLTLVHAILPSSGTKVEVMMISQTPDPVEPGQVFTVKFKIENEGDQVHEDVIVKLKPTYPLSLYSGTVEKNIGKLPAGLTGADAVIVEYKLRVAADAAEGSTELELEVEMGGGGLAYFDDEFSVNVQTRDAILEIVSINTQPEQIPPGESAEITFVIENRADSMFKDVSFKLDLTGDDLPLAPYQSSSKKTVDYLESGEQATLRFKLIADPEAKPGLYKVPLNITYNNELGNATTIEDVLAVKIGNFPRLRVHVKKSTVRSEKQEGLLTLEIANAGTTDVKLVELRLLESDEYELVTPSNYFYIGDIDADDTESEEMHIYVNRVKDDDLTIPVNLKYFDANNKPLEQNMDIIMQLYSGRQLRKFGLVESGGAGIWIVLLALGGGGYYWYRHRKKKSTEKPAS
jgi:hypothetical protein